MMAGSRPSYGIRRVSSVTRFQSTRQELSGARSRVNSASPPTVTYDHTVIGEPPDSVASWRSGR